jgi:formylmethanofuran dehydrogenase subunit E
MDMVLVEELIAACASLHRRVSPRQIIGVRMGLHGGELLGIEVPQSGKRLFTVAESDGSWVDGLTLATNCSIGHRNLRIEDLGKIAATFVNSHTGKSVRLAPRTDAKERARLYAQTEKGNWQSQIVGYKSMPDGELFDVQAVEILTSVSAYLSRPGAKAICAECGEEVINEREVCRDGQVYCRTCAGAGYYRLLPGSADDRFRHSDQIPAPTGRGAGRGNNRRQPK